MKDKAFPGSLLDASTAQELQAASRALMAALQDEPDAILVISGDLTSKGNLTEYQKCVDFLVRAFDLTDQDRWDGKLAVVPGNHDVNRDLAATTDSDVYAKFEPLADAWRQHGLDVVASDEVKKTTMRVGDGHVNAYSLNSCLGCGERRPLPSKVIDRIRQSFECSDHGTDDVMALLDDALGVAGETIDAPAFAEKHIHFVHNDIKSDPNTELAVLIAHHNLLQQAMPRFDLYTDVVNAGMVRSRLTSLAIPVLYLHGHIHSDPVESVLQSAPDTGQLICVSAPEFRDGFNRIDIALSADGVPLGCVVRRIRVRLHGGMSEESAVRVRFDRYESALSPAARSVALIIVGGGSIADPSSLRNEAGLMDSPDVGFTDALRELEWLGLIEILNGERHLRHWRLRAVAV